MDGGREAVGDVQSEEFRGAVHAPPGKLIKRS